jgi:pyruvate dehydrogenase complex dehydrogenase (E1) component
MAALPQNAQTDDAAISKRDADPQETKEWQDALDSVIDREGARRAHYLIERMIEQARGEGIDIPYSATTEYINTIPTDQQPKYPGNPDLEIRIHNYIRWNAMAMVVRANKDTNVGGHIASFASAAALYDVLACSHGTTRRRPCLLPGPLGARHLCARSLARSSDRRTNG